MNDMHALGQLIQEAQDRNGWSLRDLQDRAKRRGFAMSHSNFGRLKSEPVTSIKGENLHMLQQVLKVPMGVVATAALDSMGITTRGTWDASIEDVVRESTELSEYDQELLTAMLRVMLGRTKGLANHDEQDHEHRERSTTAGHRGAAGGDAGAGQKTAAPAGAPADGNAGVRPEDLDLAAHPYMELSRDRQDAAWGDVGEENQDPGDEAGA